MARALLTVFSALLAHFATAHGAPITSNGFETFSRQNFGGLMEDFTGGPREVGTAEDQVAFTSSNPRAVFAYTSAYGLGENGSWGGGRRGFVGLNVAFGWLRFDFDQPVSGVGAFMNYAPPAASFGAATLTLLSADDTVLETLVLNEDAPISTDSDSVDAGAFRGFSRARGDIHAFVVSDGFSVIDNFTWSRDNVAPEPVPLPAPAITFMFPALFLLWRGGKGQRAKPSGHGGS